MTTRRTTTARNRYAGAGAGIVLGLMLVAVLAAPSALARAAGAGGGADEHKVALCHATASHTNPYVSIEVDYHSVIMAGHGDHTGPMWHPGIEDRWGDIIPPFDFGPGATYAGMNWSAEGQAILAGGCELAPATTTTTAPATTTTAGPATTTTMAPGSTVPETSTTVPETTTTVETFAAAAESTTTAVVQGQSVVAPARVLGISATPDTATVAGALPTTGTDSGLLVGVALCLLAGGAVLVVHARRRA